ncbi:siderophore ABC transporter substrate-binding protein [Gallibacterium anatis]|uniref:ABC transporter substrate-binding protein n=1 Tax=Gallibacterium anatis TaxID=750 RepID=A0A921HAM7_9PAST|nr:ABC transporter substrate-binding protein [Gallibacterium anatis]KGQ66029.1 ABC transporter [Gallibacterium anatis 7990]MBP4133202.1 ABC transporter substrate-binding protein [Gallibacterium anatis]WIM82742.1 ABC transporter substrate-binding protein [Gallibacterium anatis]WIM85616.1 ABC transporter substrate-binding protein [Gallibacterium anatis]WKS98255.1 ABC transporter substrate-binding protein [Gallibacterium anatis]
MKKSLKFAIGLLGFFIGTSAYAADITVDSVIGKQTIPQDAKRIVVLDFGVADTLRELNAEDRIVGIPKSSALPAYLESFKADKFENVGSLPEPAFEKINELNPDLIIASGRQQKMLDRFKEIAPVFYYQNDYNNYYPSLVNNFEILGKIVNKEEVAKQKIAELDKKVDELNKFTKGKNALLILVNENRISAYGDTSRYSLVYQKFGFTPADKNIKSSTHGMSVGFEYIVEKNPDYLLVVDRTAAITDKKDNAKIVLNNDLIKKTKAYQQNHIIYLDAANWYLAFGGLKATENMISELEQAIQ